MSKEKSKLFTIIGIILAVNIYTFAIDIIQFTYLIFYIFIFSVLLLSNFKYTIRYGTEIIIFAIPITSLFFSLLYTYDFIRGYKFTLFFTVFLFIQIILSNRNDWHKSFLYSILILSSIIVAATYIGYFFPDLYLKWFLPLFNDKSQIVMLRLMKAGAQVGLTNQTAANGFLISIGLGVIINQLLHSKKSKVLMYLFITIYIIALIMTLKRSFLIANIVCITIMFCLNLKFNNKRLNYFVKTLVVISVTLMVMFILEPFTPVFNKVVERFTITDFGDFTSGRLRIYKSGYELFKERPFIGNGIYSTPSLLNDKFGLYGIQQMHNIYLQLLVELGLIGAIIFITLIVTIYLMTYRLLKKSYCYNQKNLKFVLGTSFYIQNLWLIYGFFGNPLTEHTFLLTYLLFLSIPLYYYKKNKVKQLIYEA